MKISVNNNSYEIKKCSNFFDKLKGMMFVKKKLNYGLLFNRCNSIHTFFMFQKIDVIFIDDNYKVIKIMKDLKPLRIIFCSKAKHVLEFSSKIIRVKVGDILIINQ